MCSLYLKAGGLTMLSLIGVYAVPSRGLKS
jgi:hypothetical protein